MRAILFVFLGSCSYGILSTFVKLAYDAGFRVDEVIGSQIFSGWIMLLIAVLLFSRRKIRFKMIVAIVCMGITTGLTSIFYYSSLQTTPASIAIVLLFQFTWIGVILEAIFDRKRPSRVKVASLVLILIGTLIAAGVFETHSQSLTAAGIVYGLLSAVTYSLFIFFSGKAAHEVPALNRTFLMVSGALLFVLIYHPPVFLVNGSIAAGLWKYGLLLGFFGMVVPTLFFASGVPQIGAGLASILGAAELPVAVGMSALVLSEAVSSWQWVGVVLILLSIAMPHLVNRKKNHPRLSEGDEI